MVRRVTDWLWATRAETAALAGASGCVGVAIAGRVHRAELIVAYGLAITMTYAGGFALHDVQDVRVDALNTPTRPVVCGRIQRGRVVSVGWSLMVLGLLVACMVGWTAVTVCAGIAAFLYFYSRTLKRVVFLKNLSTALVGMAPLTMPLLQGGATRLAVWAGGMGVWIIATRELLHDLRDEAGDRQCGIVTIAVLAGQRVTRCIVLTSLGGWAAVVGMSGVALVSGRAGLYIVAASGVTCVATLLALWGYPRGRNTMHVVSQLLYLAPALVLLGILVRD